MKINDSYLSKTTPLVSFGISVLFSSASISSTDISNLLTVEKVPVYAVRDKITVDSGSSAVSQYIPDNSIMSKADDETLVYIEKVHFPKKKTEKFHFIGKSKHKTVFHPRFFA